MKAYEEIKKLEAALSGDQDLRERYREKVDDLAKQNGTLRLSELAALAAEQIGYNLSASAFETAAQMQPVDDDEIEAVSGGRSVDTGRAFDLNAWIGSLVRGLMIADSTEKARRADEKRTLERKDLHNAHTPEKL